jgi:hypothetical protein
MPVTGAVEYVISADEENVVNSKYISTTSIRMGERRGGHSLGGNRDWSSLYCPEEPPGCERRPARDHDYQTNYC